MLFLLHTSVGIVGALLLYFALFLRETDEGKLQNRLEELWVRIDDLSRTALTKQAAFLQQVSAFLGSAFDRTFGNRLLSAEAVSVSLCLSVAAVVFALVFLEAAIRETTVFPPGIFVLLALVTILLGISPAPVRYLGFAWSPIVAIVVFARAVEPGSQPWNLGRIVEEVSRSVSVLSVLLVLGGGAISDILFVAVTRWGLRYSSRLRKTGGILLVLAANGLLGLLLFLGPIYFALVFDGHRGWGWAWLRDAVLVLGFSNLLDVLVGLLSVLVSAIALAHLVVWPLMERPIYSAQRYGLVRQPRLLAATGVVALLFAWPNNPVVQSVTALVRGK